jgi:hypothetical protein
MPSLAKEQKMTLEQHSEQLPRLIAMPTMERSHHGWLRPPDRDTVAEDLPSRLFIGDLTEFRKPGENSEWDALYEDPDGELKARLSLSGDFLYLKQEWKGEPHCCAVKANIHDKLPLYARNVASLWQRQLEDAVLPRYNIHLFPYDDRLPDMICFPDGVLLTLACPIAVRDLRKAYEFQESLQSDSNIRTPIVGYCSLVEGTCERRVQEGFQHEHLHPLMWKGHIEAVGIAPTALSEAVRDDSGLIRLVQHRRHYMYCIMFSLRELGRVLARLVEEELIGDRNPIRSDESLSARPAWAAMLFQQGREHLVRNHRYFTADRYQRITYPSVGDLDELDRLMTRQFSASESIAAIEKAEAYSERTIELQTAAEGVLQ